MCFPIYCMSADAVRFEITLVQGHRWMRMAAKSMACLFRKLLIIFHPSNKINGQTVLCVYLITDDSTAQLFSEL